MKGQRTVQPDYEEFRDRLVKQLISQPDRERGYVGTTAYLIFPPTEEHVNPFPVCGIGLSKTKAGEEQLAILTSVPKEDLMIEDFLSKADVPIDGLNIQVFHTGVILATARPVMGGDSVSLGSNVTGTIGAAVRDATGKSLVLSCNHVIANLNSGKKGADEIWEPGHANGGTSADRLGVLHDYCPIVLGSTSPNSIDAAVGEPDNPTDVSAGIRSIGLISGVNTAPALNIPVRKNGQKTLFTSGILAMRKLAFITTFPQGSSALFDNQYGILGTSTKTNFAAAGDSGAVVVDDQNQAVGLLFATAGEIDLSFANPIADVLNYFTVSFM